MQSAIVFSVLVFDYKVADKVVFVHTFLSRVCDFSVYKRNVFRQKIDTCEVDSFYKTWHNMDIQSLRNNCCAPSK